MAGGEAALIRDCSSLYASFAFESLSSTLLAFSFLYLMLLILCRHRVNNPGLAMLRIVGSWASSNSQDVLSTLRTWHTMPRAPLEERFVFCRKLNMSICTFSAVVALLAVTRWLHVGNVNGFRYLGYALTCPLMQVELVVLVAPIVPCFRVNVLFTALVTFSCMISGYIGSMIEGDLWTGSLREFAGTFDFDDLAPTMKFWVVAPSFACLTFLTFIQLPWLALLYTIRGGTKYEVQGRTDLPCQYRRLIFLVQVTWLLFPAVWLISHEGMSIVSDTKWNGFAFALANIISKGSFSIRILNMVRLHKARIGRRNSREELSLDDEPSYITFMRKYDNVDEDFWQRPQAVKNMEEGQHIDSAEWPIKVSDWAVVDDDYKEFLRGAGVTDKSFLDQDALARVNLRARYLEVAHLSTVIHGTVIRSEGDACSEYDLEDGWRFDSVDIECSETRLPVEWPQKVSDYL